MVISRWRTGQFVQGRSCRLLCIIASIEYIRRQIEESLTSCIKGLIRKFTEIRILTIQSGVNKRNKNRGEHSVIKHQFSIHSYVPVIKKYHASWLSNVGCIRLNIFHFSLQSITKTSQMRWKSFVYVQEWSLCFLKLFVGKRCSGLVFCPDFTTKFIILYM